MEILVLVSSRFGQVNRANTWEGVQTFTSDIIANGDIIVASGNSIRLDGSPTGDTRIVESSPNVTDFFAANGIIVRLSILKFQGRTAESTVDPVTEDISAGFWSVFNNTTSNDVFIAANDGGVIKKVALV